MMTVTDADQPDSIECADEILGSASKVRSEIFTSRGRLIV
jgi:hypothetical protein